MLKRTISLLVVLTMILSCLGGMAFADAKYTTETTSDG